jgi:hypothetical protein
MSYPADAPVRYINAQELDRGLLEQLVLIWPAAFFVPQQ